MVDTNSKCKEIRRDAYEDIIILSIVIDKLFTHIEGIVKICF